MADILAHVEGEEYINPEDIDESAILGDDLNDSTKVKKEEAEGDDLYDAAMEPSTLNEKRESIESTSTTSVVKKESNVGVANSSYSQQNHANSSSSSSVSGKRYCCYIGNMTWWTTDADIQSAVSMCGVNLGDFVDLKFHENRNNGQSKGFALAVFSTEAAVRTVSDKLSHRKVHGQNLAVLPYNKQSLAKLEDATKRVDAAGKKDEKQGMLNIGTVRIGPVSSSPMNLGMNRPPPSTVVQTPTNLMNITFPAGGPPGSGPPPQFQVRAGAPIGGGGTPQQSNIPALLQNHLHPSPSGTLQTQLPPPSQHSGVLPSLHQAPPLTATAQPLGFSGPPPSTNVPPPSVMNRPPPNMSAPPPSATGMPPVGQPPLLVNTSAPPPGMPPSFQPSGGSAMRAPIAQQHPGMPPTSQPGFPPGAHINPQVYPSFAQGFTAGVPRGYPENGGAMQHVGGNGSMISEAEFEEIMNRNRTVSSSAINRAVSDATAGDYGSAIETLVTAISLIRQSRVAGDDRCKVLVAALQDTLQGIESKSYNSRKHRSRDRSPSDRSGSSRKRHRGRGSRSRSRSPRDRYDYSRRY